MWLVVVATVVCVERVTDMRINPKLVRVMHQVRRDARRCGYVSWRSNCGRFYVRALGGSVKADPITQRVLALNRP